MFSVSWLVGLPENFGNKQFMYMFRLSDYTTVHVHVPFDVCETHLFSPFLFYVHRTGVGIWGVTGTTNRDPPRMFFGRLLRADNLTWQRFIEDNIRPRKDAAGNFALDTQLIKASELSAPASALPKAPKPKPAKRKGGKVTAQVTAMGASPKEKREEAAKTKTPASPMPSCSEGARARLRMVQRIVLFIRWVSVKMETVALRVSMFAAPAICRTRCCSIPSSDYRVHRS